jgi:hydroxypyruvate reductase
LNPSRAQLRATAAGILSAALRAAAPGPLVSRNLKLRGRVLEAGGTRCRLGRGRIVLVAVGKAALEMAREAELLLGDRLAEGIAVATTAPKQPLARVRVREAGHPIPDARGIAAARSRSARARPWP